MDLALKFNPNHDPQTGRFTFGSGLGFVSPNVEEGLDFVGAKSRLTDADHQTMLNRFREVDDLLGLYDHNEVRTDDAVGAWSDGAENSSVSRYAEAVDYDTLKTSLAMKGWLAHQKAVVVFKADAAGPNTMYYADVPVRDYEALHKQLLQSGVEYHTIVPTARGARVYSFDASDDGSGAPAFNTFIGAHHVQARVLHGRGEFLGSWTSREEGRAAYEKQIAAFFGQRRLRRGRLAERWRRLQSDAETSVQKLDALGFLSRGDVLGRFVTTPE